MSVFEAGMMACFGASWPIAVYKTYKSKSVKGKSMRFLCLIMLGYMLGLIHKIFFYSDWVIWLYILNMCFVGSDMLLYVKYKNN